MYLCEEAVKVLAEMGLPREQVQESGDTTLLYLVSEYARHRANAKGAAVKIHARLEKAINGEGTQTELGDMTEVRNHDEAIHAMKALNGPLGSAARAWKEAHQAAVSA